MPDLRAYVFLDSLQPQCASYLATVARGFLPVAGQASLFVEISPGIAINHVTDVALKTTDVVPGMQIVERLYGMLELHASSQADVRQAGAAVLRALDRTEDQRIKPKLFSSQVIRNVSDHQAMLLNRVRQGNMLLPGQSLYVMELAPAAYAALADWWSDTVRDTRVYLITGHAVSRIGSGREWSAAELPNQLRFNCTRREIAGSALFSYRHVFRPDNQARRAGVSHVLKRFWTRKAKLPWAKGK